ncbi:MAG: hypothetical protein PVI01_11195, partial [Gemmatimonadales bacterium]
MILPTRRALVLFAGLAPVALLGFAHSLGLDLLIALDIGLLAAVVVDARLSVDPKRIEIDRRAPEGFSVGRQAEISYLWRNPTRHRARLSVREIRPDLLGGVQEARSLDVPAQGVRKESLTA